MASSDPVKRVLVVDDEDYVRQLLCRVLASKGYTVDAAADGREGLEKITAVHPDLVLLDLMMPVMDGWQVLDALAQMEQHPPVVIVSAYVDRGRALKAGAVECLSKPFAIGQLLTTCEKALDV